MKPRTSRTLSANWAATTTDSSHMRAALALARRGLGRVWPNPAVGCVLVKDNHPIARGWTRAGGRPHAEAEALARAGESAETAEGATAYVTLEPCAHTGETPPCAEALIDAGVKRAVIAIEDPDPRVSGKGIEMLKAAGIEVTTGVGEEEAGEINAGFFSRLTRGRPLLTLKTATTLDGRIATRTGDSRWITGPEARRRGHMMRAMNDAVITGIGTVLADDPSLTCRLPSLEDRSPVRIVVDSKLRLPPESKLARTAGQTPVWVATLTGGDGKRRRALENAGVKIIEMNDNGRGRVDLAALMAELGSLGLTRVMAEGGAGITAELLRLELVDRLAWFRAPRVIGGDGTPGAAAFGLDALSAAPGFKSTGISKIGPDILETYEFRP